MNTLLDTFRYFILITSELIAIFLLISAIIEFILMYVSEDKMQKSLSGKGIWSNVVAACFGALTPFCACSTIPMTVGLLNAKAPFGATMSFLISSPLLNPIVIGMLGALVSVKAAIAYFLLGFISSVVFGYVLEKAGYGNKYVKMSRVKLHFQTEKIDKKALPFKEKVKLSFLGAWGTLHPVMLDLLIGVGIGAAIYGYMPDDFVLKIAGPDNQFAVPVAAVIGIPLYIRAETAIPIGVALMEKGMSIGAVIALIIGGAGMAIPEMSTLKKIKNQGKAFILKFMSYFYGIQHKSENNDKNRSIQSGTSTIGKIYQSDFASGPIINIAISG